MIDFDISHHRSYYNYIDHFDRLSFENLSQFAMGNHHVYHYFQVGKSCLNKWAIYTSSQYT